MGTKLPEPLSLPWERKPVSSAATGSETLVDGLNVVRRPQVDLNELCDGARAAFGEDRGGGGVGTDLGVPVLDEQRSKTSEV